ncbi:amino acid permease [Aliifodinibius sp. S!AR15-10]|uniref:amino acid permease n=1 Tax=Aliifodinibius sp. S!AR15-10 TaxID=2950437 RepID=UPI0028569960|nr:amino acid permease [Aliifodinibius sp. S!AR15-10]MDR8392909.1 amino acid permease [Aliifodinibius sp. S!AR15-10]
MADLRRELGFWDALTIGAGTMIGAGIFLLAGVALELTGPAAIFSYLAAGLICIITASSAAELATGMPTSGGDYFFVSRSLGPAFGAISGVGIWLSLTFAISFYLFGLGEYLSQFLPLTPFWGAFLGGVLLVILNIIGAKESGRTQVVVVLTLLAILGGFSAVGFFHIDEANLNPFFPMGVDPIYSTTALVFVSFLGFVKIAAVAEEIKDPAKNLPRALIGSVALVTLLYMVILLVIAGMFPQSTIRDVRDPLTTAAREMMGGFGGIAIIFAGLLATLSSANASIMASSRINLAMARDRMVPNWLSEIHKKLLTPYRAILLTGILALGFLLIESLEDLAKIASVLQLYSYAALNIGCVVLRAANPDWYKPTYRTPGNPYGQVFAAIGCLGVIIYSGPFAQIAVVVLIVVSLGWYLIWGRGKVEIEHALPEFSERWEEYGWSLFRQPAEEVEREEVEEWIPVLRPLNTSKPRHLVTALANPEHETDLLRLAQFISAGKKEAGIVEGMHILHVPYQTPISSIREKLEQKPSTQKKIDDILKKSRETHAVDNGYGEVLMETDFRAVTEAAHNVFGAIISETQTRNADMLLMGWQGGFSVGRIYNSPVQRIIKELKTDVGILKDRGLDKLDSILLPWGGGLHAWLGLELAVRIARVQNAELRILRLVKPGTDLTDEKTALRKNIGPLLGDFERAEIIVREAQEVTSGIMEEFETHDHDLVIIGASHEWSIRNVLFGTIPDIVADRAPCSVLMVRRYLPEHWSVKASESFKRVKENLGLTSSPNAGQE